MRWSGRIGVFLCALVVTSAACAHPPASSAPSTVGAAASDDDDEEPDDPGCRAANRILRAPSRFVEALRLWSTEPEGSARALAALAGACDAASASPDVAGTEAAACSLLGLLQAAGEGVPRDPVAALASFQRGATCELSFGAQDLWQAVNQGIDEHDSQCCLGIECPRSCAAACARASAQVVEEIGPPLRSACNAGRGAACYMLGELARGEFIQGVGPVRLPADRDAVDKAACATGLGLACAGDPHRACDLGWGPGCLDVGMDADRAKHTDEALAAWTRACSLGMTTVCAQLKDRRAH